MRRRRRKTTRNSRALPATSTWGVVPFFFSIKAITENIQTYRTVYITNPEDLN